MSVEKTRVHEVRGEGLADGSDLTELAIHESVTCDHVRLPLLVGQVHGYNSRRNDALPLTVALERILHRIDVAKVK